MPKAKRKPEEIEAVKNDILQHAVLLMVEEGYDGFSMRKLAARLEVSAKTIYNYFRNKDDLYLSILTYGFEDLYQHCLAATQARKDPVEKVEAIMAAFMDYGLENPQFYNLMFTWHVPKFNDYVGTIMEPAARIELETATQLLTLFMETIMSCLPEDLQEDIETVRFLAIRNWAQAHGYIAGFNNNIMLYMHPDPISLKDAFLERIKKDFRNDIARMVKAPEGKISSIRAVPDSRQE